MLPINIFFTNEFYGYFKLMFINYFFSIIAEITTKA